MVISPEWVGMFQQKYLPLQILELPPGSPTELICPHTRAPDDTYSSAIALIGRSVPHHHDHTQELYILRSGKLRVMTRGLYDSVWAEHVMSVRGETHEIRPGTLHYAEGLDGPAEVMVLTWPPWSKKDHHVFTGKL